MVSGLIRRESWLSRQAKKPSRSRCVHTHLVQEPRRIKEGLMSKTLRRIWQCFVLSPFAIVIAAFGQGSNSQIGREVAIPIHLQDGEEFTIPTAELIQFGAKLFNAKFTIQEGAGRPHLRSQFAPSISEKFRPHLLARCKRVLGLSQFTYSRCRGRPGHGSFRFGAALRSFDDGSQRWNYDARCCG